MADLLRIGGGAHTQTHTATARKWEFGWLVPPREESPLMKSNLSECRYKYLSAITLTFIQAASARATGE
jgi:hypothetical protein